MLEADILFPKLFASSSAPAQPPRTQAQKSHSTTRKRADFTPKPAFGQILVPKAGLSPRAALSQPQPTLCALSEQPHFNRSYLHFPILGEANPALHNPMGFPPIPNSVSHCIVPAISTKPSQPWWPIPPFPKRGVASITRAVIYHRKQTLLIQNLFNINTETSEAN